MSGLITKVIILSTLVIVAAAPMFIMAHAEKTAMGVCQIDHSFETGFKAINP